MTQPAVIALLKLSLMSLPFLVYVPTCYIQKYLKIVDDTVEIPINL